MIFFGPADFRQGIGDPNGSDPRIDQTRRLVAKTARKHGKFAGTVGSPANFDVLVEMGYTFISTGADVVGLWQYFQSLTAAVSGRDIGQVKTDAEICFTHDTGYGTVGYELWHCQYFRQA